MTSFRIPRPPLFRRAAWCVALALPLAAAVSRPAAAADEPVVVRATAHFGVDRAQLRPRDRDRLLSEVAALKDVTWQSVRTTGHTDSTGPAGHNRRLSVQRANAVKAYLVEQGLDAAMVRAEGVASAQPVAPDATPGGRARNRRADVSFHGVRTVASR